MKKILKQNIITVLCLQTICSVVAYSFVEHGSPLPLVLHNLLVILLLLLLLFFPAAAVAPAAAAPAPAAAAPAAPAAVPISAAAAKSEGGQSFRRKAVRWARRGERTNC